jgi:hypothetical protein
MTGPPAARPGIQEAAGAGPRGSEKPEGLSAYVRVVNAAWNGSGYIKRKKADYYVKGGRAFFVCPDQLRLIQSHTANLAAASAAAAGYESIMRTMTLDELAHIPIMRPSLVRIGRSRQAK